MARAKQPPPFDDAALDALIGDTKTPEDLSMLFRQLQKRLAERILAGELTDHLGYAPGTPKPEGQSNHRNGVTPKDGVDRDRGDECHRESAHAAPEDREDTRTFSDGRGRDQVALPRAPDHSGQVATWQPRVARRDPVSGRTLRPAIY